MAIIEKPINLINVANTLGYYEYKPHPVTGVNRRYVNLRRLCTHPNVNMWSKYKPVAFESLESITDTDRASVDWGFRAFSYPTYQEAAASGWTYKKPMGGKSEPFRLTDFEKYNHEAQPFVTSVPQDVTVSNQIPQMFELGIDLNASDFELVDFSGNIGSFYYGIVFVKGNSKYIQTAKINFGVGEGSILVETTHPFFTLGGTIEANHILVNQKIEEFTLLSNIVNDAPTYISLPTAGGVSNISTIIAIPVTANIEITKVGFDAQFLTDVAPYATEGGEKYLSSKAVYVQIDIQNIGNSVITLENMSMSATPTYFSSDGFSYPANMFDILGDPINIFTIPQNSSRKVIIGIDDILNTDGGVVVPIVPENLRIFSNIRIYNKGVLFTSRHIGFQSSLDL